MNNGLVALFVDYENLFHSVQEQLRRPVQLQKILEVAQRYGRVIVRRAYADWSSYGQYQKELYMLGIEQIHVSGRTKNAADIRLTIDVVSIVEARDLPLTHVVLASGDGDFTELVHYLHRRGKFVVGLGLRATSAVSLIAACDEFVYYDDLLKKVPEEDEVNRYIKALEPKIRMTSNPYRPWIILDFYRLIKQNPGLSLNALNEKLREHYQQHHPEVPQVTVTEVIHQLFHTFCFEFTPPYGQDGPPLWERVASLKKGIHSGGDLLKSCDLGVLRVLSSKLKDQPIDPVIAAKLLYGSSEDPRLVEYIRELIKEIEQ